tara:strand:+ start:3128 stop:4399 length:1272 start_codon:yes stop_codon:yes gene_type:complete
MYFWYKFFTYLIYPFSTFYLFIRILNKKEDPKRYKEKLSKINIRRDDGFLVWFHVASVGEAMSILPLIENFENEKNVKKILITSITLSSAQILEKKYNYSKKIVHQFLPLDIPIFVNKFLNYWNPNLAIFIDSEIWPNLILNIKKKNIPLLLINGRITRKTFLKWNLSRNFAKKIFEKFDLCIASNKETEDHLRALGAKNIKNYGNLKFAKTKKENEKKLDLNFIDKIKNKKIWCAASTHPSEEIFCAKTHLELKKTYSDILTIIIPRHISRADEINNQLSNLNLKVVKYTNFANFKDDTDVLLVDTYGEAIKFYNIAKCVFVGKSLLESLKDVSGQNPIEPSRLGCKIFHGPNVSNFKDVYEYLGSLNVAKKVEKPKELSAMLVDELKTEKTDNYEIVEKLENYGTNTLNNVLREIKIYINN